MSASTISEKTMPFYQWDKMVKKNIAKPSESEGSIIIGENITLNRSVSQPGKVAKPHFHGCEQILNVVQGTAQFRVGIEEKRFLKETLSIFRLG